MKMNQKFTKSTRLLTTARCRLTHVLDRNMLVSELERIGVSSQISLPIIKRKRRNRPSVLDPHFPYIAAFISKRMSYISNKKDIRQFTLQNLVDKLKTQKGLIVSKSALSRYISKHSALKVIYK